jgi:hypothetical protein
MWLDCSRMGKDLEFDCLKKAMTFCTNSGERHEKND